MYKYLAKKIEDAGISIEICLIAFAINGESELMEDFSQRPPKQICETLGWRQKQEIYNEITRSIEDGEFAGLMYQSERTGFLARLSIPLCSGFRFASDGRVSSCYCSSGNYYAAYIYAHTLGELTDKAIKKQEQYFAKDIEKFKASKSEG